MKKAWPTKDAMKQIYEQHLWGTNQTPFYSGDGSHNPDIINPYIKAVKNFLLSFQNPLTVCDLGCGDFNIGKQLVPYTNHYHATDIVPELITYNQQRFRFNNLEFTCLNIATDPLPIADCAIIRQVLQHLNNKEVKQIVNKLGVFKYVLLTEHVPSGQFTANKDIISGQGIRLKKQSGLDIAQAPFNLPIVDQTTLVTTHLPNNKGKIVTTLLTLF
ncbi:class I SAM-dependent methyltransferase [Bizionia sediminis]|uniref:Class I SAM-dependent methyltransferase n=1 Tax=Bizionia sediminis TaxID=1737064 RepID=A0ABW5KQ22_9FLAO